MTYIVEEDGVTHINVYSKGRTELGRWLSNFAHSPFIHPVYGEFASVEALWYYVATGCKHESLRPLHGWQAKAWGKKHERVEMDTSEFAQIIKTGIRAKLIANPQHLGMLIDSTLPLSHYYVYGGKTVPAGYEWIILYIEDIRSSCQQRDYHPFKEIT